MRGGLDQTKVGLNSTLEAVQFLSPRHPLTSGVFVLIYTIAIPSSLLAVNPNKRLEQRTSRAQAPESQLHPRFRHDCSLFRVHPGLRPEIPNSISGIPANTLPPGHLPNNSERPQLTVPSTQLPLSASLFSNHTGLISSGLGQFRFLNLDGFLPRLRTPSFTRPPQSFISVCRTRLQTLPRGIGSSPVPAPTPRLQIQPSGDRFQPSRSPPVPSGLLPLAVSISSQDRLPAAETPSGPASAVPRWNRAERPSASFLRPCVCPAWPCMFLDPGLSSA